MFFVVEEINQILYCQVFLWPSIVVWKQFKFYIKKFLFFSFKKEIKKLSQSCLIGLNEPFSWLFILLHFAVLLTKSINMVRFETTTEAVWKVERDGLRVPCNDWDLQLFVTVFNAWEPLTIVTNGSIWDVTGVLYHPLLGVPEQ